MAAVTREWGDVCIAALESAHPAVHAFLTEQLFPLAITVMILTNRTTHPRKTYPNRNWKLDGSNVRNYTGTYVQENRLGCFKKILFFAHYVKDDSPARIIDPAASGSRHPLTDGTKGVLFFGQRVRQTWSSFIFPNCEMDHRNRKLVLATMDGSGRGDVTGRTRD